MTLDTHDELTAEMASELTPETLRYVVRLRANEPPAVLDWEDVVSRGGRSARKVARVRGRIVAVAFATAVLVLAVPTALAIAFGRIDFGSSDPAPEAVVAEFATLDTAAPPDMAPQVDARQTRSVRTVTAGGVRYPLYVAPTRTGGFCYQWSGSFGGCDRLGTTPLSVSWGQRLVGGHVAAAYVDSVEVVLASGDRRPAEITWVSKPIDNGFFLFDPGSADHVVAVVAIADGRELTRQQPHRPALTTSPPALADLERAKEEVRIETPDGAASILAAPSRVGGRCYWIVLGGKTFSFWSSDGCLPAGYEVDRPAVRFLRTGSRTVIASVSNDEYTELEIVLDSGRVSRVPLRSFALASVPATEGAVTGVVVRGVGHRSHTFTAPADDRP